MKTPASLVRGTRFREPGAVSVFPNQRVGRLDGPRLVPTGQRPVGGGCPSGGAAHAVAAGVLCFVARCVGAQQRIVQALEAREDWTVDDTLALQLDQRCLPWSEMRDMVLNIPPASDDARTALELLRSWDGVVDAGSPAATVFEFFAAEMMRRVVTARAPRAAKWALGLGFNRLVPRSVYGFRRFGQLTRLLRERPDGWLDGGLGLGGLEGPGRRRP